VAGRPPERTSRLCREQSAGLAATAAPVPAPNRHSVPPALDGGGKENPRGSPRGFFAFGRLRWRPIKIDPQRAPSRHLIGTFGKSKKSLRRLRR
jgi:hypothetical protein